MFTYDVYGVVLVWKHPNTILTQDYGTIELSDFCSTKKHASCYCFYVHHQNSTYKAVAY